MSTEKSVGDLSSPSNPSIATAETSSEKRDQPSSEPTQIQSQESTVHHQDKSEEETVRSESAKPKAQTSETGKDEQKKAAVGHETPSGEGSTPRQVIAVSASKGPAAFFNLARKFLVTDEMCDLSALEGAIVSAVDAAHLLERSQLATIVRVHTSYVTVEPKRRKQAPQQDEEEEISGTPRAAFAAAGETTAVPTGRSSAWASPAAAVKTTASRHGSRGSSGRELRRARIVITVRRTDSYKRWLEENPLQAIIAGDADDPDADQSSKSSRHP